METSFSFNQKILSRDIEQLINKVIRYTYTHKGAKLPSHLMPTFSPPASVVLSTFMACFVSFSYKGVLRGCAGTTLKNDTLANNIAWYAHEAALNDPRFDHISLSELDNLTYKVSVLSQFNPITIASEADLKAQISSKYGLMIQYGQLSGALLPCQWRTYPTVDLFVDALKEKSNWPSHAWTKAMRAYVFEAYYYEGEIQPQLNQIS